MPGVAGKPMTIEGSAVHDMDDITLVLNVSGTMTDPKIRLESLPPLPPADVLSYLVFGAPVRHPEPGNNTWPWGRNNWGFWGA